ncbi:MAG: phosphotransferase [Proteobacteria bacterium]|nr:phosphotransferase [Pseudomonadota bacterium]
MSRYLEFGPEEELSAHFRLAGRKLSGRLLELSKEHLRVEAPDDVDQVWVEGTRVTETQLRFVAEPFAMIGVLALKQVRIETDGSISLRFEPTNPGARAALWMALDDLDQGESSLLALDEDSLVDPPRIPARGVYTEEARLERLAYARQISGAPLEHAATTRLRAEKLTGNIENFFGAVEIPVGLAGPLYFRGTEARGMLYAPLATTEGALVASATRGARAISQSGGVTTRVVQQRMMRVPLFVLSDMRGALLFVNWIRDHVAEIREQTTKVSRHAKLVSIEPKLMGNMVHVSFLYETGDAAGQNMTTTCTWRACQWVMKELQSFNHIRFENFIIEANMSGDKKVNFASLIQGRGTRVTAEALLTREACTKVLKVSPEQLLKTNQGFLAGSVGIGMVGFNINIANVIGAMFTATGQDIACVHESSLGQLHLMPADDGGVYASIMLPSLIVGTVGGGTALPTQWEFLEMLGCAGPGKAHRLAEIIAGFCLALDLSTLSAIASGQFATAHEKMGRNHPVRFFTAREMTAPFFTNLLRPAIEDPSVTVTKAVPVIAKLGSSIITELTARKVDKLVGLFPFQLELEGRDPLDVLVKSKPLDDEVLVMLGSMATACGARVGSAWTKVRDLVGFRGCHTKELEIYAQRDERFTRHVPGIYGLHADPKREIYLVVMERLQRMVHMDSADDVSGWSLDDIESALRGIAQIHAVWYGKEAELLEQNWLPDYPTAKRMEACSELWEALGVHAWDEFPRWFGKDDLKHHRLLVNSITDWWGEIEQLPRTLIHNDFNPRNLCLRPVGDGATRLCVYDWELATLGLPQHDVAEFLSFVLSDSVDEATVSHLVGVHRQALQEASGVTIPEDVSKLAWRRSLQDLVINRVPMYAMAHTFRHYGFMERLSRTLRHLLSLELGTLEPLAERSLV